MSNSLSSQSGAIYARMGSIQTGVSLPSGLIVVAGLGCVFVPVLMMIPVTMILDRQDRGIPYLIEFFVYYGWAFGLAALILALPLALYANRRGINGWLSAITTGAAFGALSSVFFSDGISADFVGATTLLGATYGACFWILSHMLYAFARKKTART